VTAAEALDRAVDALEHARGTDPGGSDFAAAMSRLVDYEIARNLETPDSVPKTSRRRAADLLAELAPQLGSYVDVTFAHAADPEAGLQHVGRRRSAIQAVLDGFAGTRAEGLIDEEDLAAIDAAIRRKADQVEPLPPDWIPDGLPAQHWWWRAPATRGRGLR
jgi:hypothetical protein